jgi:hypothetical protein
MSADKKQIEVPDNVFVECPLIEKKLRPVKRCLDCEHYDGLNERFPDEKMAFRVRFQVRCRFPFARALFETETQATD